MKHLKHVLALVMSLEEKMILQSFVNSVLPLMYVVYLISNMHSRNHKQEQVALFLTPIKPCTSS